jgi:cell division protein FtsI/penicillin-binding protein 2
VLGLLAVAAAGSDARADVSSFLALGGGATGQMAQGANTVDTASAFTYSIGVGTSPLGSIVGALMYRGATYFGLGTDIGTSLRVATGGFARGSWGAALDGGILYRTWGGGNFASSPFLGILTLGSPWGFQLALGTTFYDLGGATSAMGFTAALEMDILRFTVMRQGPSEHWWPNPNPAGGHEEKQVGLLSF